MVQARTRVMNQLQAVALNEGLHCKKKLWRERGRQQLESSRWLRGRAGDDTDLLDLLDRLNPSIAELTQAIEREVENYPAAQRLKTHPGVGVLTALAGDPKERPIHHFKGLTRGGRPLSRWKFPVAGAQP